MARGPAVYKCLAEPHVANNVATSTVDIMACTVPVAKFVKIEVGKRYFKNTTPDYHKHASKKEGIGDKVKAEDKLSPLKSDSEILRSTQTDISEDKKANSNAYSIEMSSGDLEIPAIIRATIRGGARATVLAIITAAPRLRRISKQHPIPA